MKVTFRDGSIIECIALAGDVNPLKKPTSDGTLFVLVLDKERRTKTIDIKDVINIDED